MSDITAIKTIWVEFANGERAVLNTDDEHEWVINCVPKGFDGETWATGVKTEIEQYVHTWLNMYGMTHVRKPSELHEFLVGLSTQVSAYMDEHSEYMALVEEQGL